jgi:predicted phage tail protein
MLEIVKLKNPFDRTRRETERVIFIHGKVLTEYIADIADEEFELILNGNFVEKPELTYPTDGDQIIVLPHVGSSSFKSILGMVASMWLMGFAGKIIGGSAGGIFAGLGKGTLASYLAAGAVMYVGGRIINAIFPTQHPNALSSESASSQTYGWDPPQPITGEGGIIGVTYGECIPAPQVLERHVETVNGQQYLNLLLCGGMGPVDSISDIKIGSTPIEDFTDVQIETKLGVNDQDPISFFTDTPLDQAVGLELTEVGLIQTSDSKTAASLEVTVEFPGGLYHVKDDGNLENTTVVIRFEYRLSSVMTWTAWQDWSITAAQNTAVRQSLRIDNLNPDQYDVRATIISRNTGSRYCTTVTWSVLTAYNPGKYARPNKVLVGLRILATNQLSGGIPNITWRQTRNTVYVWNPDTSQYETRSARNPIWAAYDIYHQCRYLKNINTGQMEYTVFGVDHMRLDPYWDEWVDAAAYSDEQVAGIDGAMENRFEFDAFYDTVAKRYDAAQKAANAGHAVIIPRGNNIGIKCDKPGQMVQIFGEGRTTMSSLQGSFSGTADRALAVEIVYSEVNNDFKNTQFLVRSPKWNTDPSLQDNPAQLQLFGVKRRSQAYREGVYTLANNELVAQFVTIGTDIDALVCEYGDLVGLNHSVSQIGIASSRLVSATQSTLQLDKTVFLQAGTSYQIIIQLSVDDSIVTKNIVAVEQDTTTDTLTISEPFTILPQQFDNYFFGESGKVVKPFRLVGIDKDGELRCKLSLAEYSEGVYTGDLNYPIIDYTPPSTKMFEVTNISIAEQSYRTNDGVNISTIHMVWDVPRNKLYDGFAVYTSTDGVKWKYWGSTTELETTITSIQPLQTYYLKVCVKVSILQSPGIVENIYITGKDTPPGLVPKMTITQAGTNLNVTIEQVAEPDISYYELRLGPSWDNSILVQDFTGNALLIPAPSNGTLTYWVKAFDNSGNQSITATIAIVNVVGLPNKNIIYTQTPSMDTWVVNHMWKDQAGRYRISSRKTLGDYDKFSDIFGNSSALWDDAEIILPIIDLGPTVLDESVYWIDRKGNMRLKTVQKVGDFAKFSDMFGAKLTYVEPRYVTETFVGVDINYVVKGAASVDFSYRTSLDGVSWSDWVPGLARQFSGRYLQIKINPISVDGIGQVYISGVTINIDVPDIEEVITNINLPAEITRIYYTKKFTEVKTIDPYTRNNEGRFVTNQITNRTAEYFDIVLLDSSGLPIAGMLEKATIGGY